MLKFILDLLNFINSILRVNKKVISAFLNSDEPLYIEELGRTARVNRLTALKHAIRLTKLGYLKELYKKNSQLRLFQKIKPNSEFEKLFAFVEQHY